MNRKEIKEKVFNYFENQTDKKLYNNTKIIEDLDFDSLDKIEMLINFEKEFNIKIDDDLVEEIKTISDIIDVINSLLNGKPRMIEEKNISGKYKACDEEYVPDINELKRQKKFNKDKKSWYIFPLTFWELIEKLNWKENCQKDNCTKELQEKFYQLCNGNTYVMDYFNTVRCAYRDALKTAIYDYEFKEFGSRCSDKFFKGGDDSFDDLCNHIIGLGKDATLAILDEPKLASEYFGSYVESFAYCFYYEQKS